MPTIHKLLNSWLSCLVICILQVVWRKQMFLSLSLQLSSTPEQITFPLFPSGLSCGPLQAWRWESGWRWQTPPSPLLWVQRIKSKWNSMKLERECTGRFLKQSHLTDVVHPRLTLTDTGIKTCQRKRERILGSSKYWKAVRAEVCGKARPCFDFACVTFLLYTLRWEPGWPVAWICHVDETVSTF